MTIVPEEGKSEEDYTKEELNKFRTEFANDLMSSLIRDIKHYFEPEGWFEEDYLDNMEELSIENFDNFKDYGISINIKE